MSNISSWQGTVIKGQNIGHTIGFPTANLDQIPNEDQLKPGVYLGKCQIITDTNHNLHTYNCLIYFGPRLVLKEIKNVFEVFIIDFNQNLYEQTLQVQFDQYIRHPIKFNSILELQNQLELDLQTAESLILNT